MVYLIYNIASCFLNSTTFVNYLGKFCRCYDDVPKKAINRSDLYFGVALTHYNEIHSSKKLSLGVSQVIKMHSGVTGSECAFFRCVRTPDVLAILQRSLIRVFHDMIPKK